MMNPVVRRYMAISLLIGFWVCSGAVRTVSGDTPASSSFIVHNSARLVTYEGFVMFVDHDQNSIILGEKKIMVGRFRLGNRWQVTVMKDSGGGDVDLKYYNAGQWVIIRGYEVSKTRMYACSVRAVDGYLQMDRNRIGMIKLPR